MKADHLYNSHLDNLKYGINDGIWVEGGGGGVNIFMYPGNVVFMYPGKSINSPGN